MIKIDTLPNEFFEKLQLAEDAFGVETDLDANGNYQAS